MFWAIFFLKRERNIDISRNGREGTDGRTGRKSSVRFRVALCCLHSVCVCVGAGNCLLSGVSCVFLVRGALRCVTVRQKAHASG